MKNTGKVISTNGGFATISVVRRSACESCKQKAVCGTGAHGCEHVVSLAKNTVGAKPGDTVEIISDSSLILGISFCVFVLPIILSFVSYFVTRYFTDNNTVCYIVCATVFILSALIISFSLNKRLSKSTNIEITKILGEDPEN